MDKCKRHTIINLIGKIKDDTNSYMDNSAKEKGITGILAAHGSILGFMFYKRIPVTISEIVESSKRVKSTVTIMLKTLEKHGYVKRMQCSEDRRVTYISLTQKALDIEKEFNEIAINVTDVFYKDITEEEINNLLEILEKINSNFK